MGLPDDLKDWRQHSGFEIFEEEEALFLLFIILAALIGYDVICRVLERAAA